MRTVIKVALFVHHGHKGLVGGRVEDLIGGIFRVELGGPVALEISSIGENCLGSLGQISRAEDVLDLVVGR